LFGAKTGQPGPECSLLRAKDENMQTTAQSLQDTGGALGWHALRMHPAVIISGLLQENPFYVPPAQLLREIREGRSVGTGESAAR
jgi:hypothetical protein